MRLFVGLFAARATVHVQRTHSVVVRIYKRLMSVCWFENTFEHLVVVGIGSASTGATPTSTMIVRATPDWATPDWATPDWATPDWATLVLPKGIVCYCRLCVCVLAFFAHKVAYPFPLTNRDYFYMRRCKEMAFTTKGKQQTAWVTISRCMPPDLQLCPETSALRVDEYKQTMAITTHESGQGSRLYMNTFDNPKGSIPTWLINYFASSGVASYLDSVKKAVENYKK